jgi:hypothetical protein
MSRSLFAQHRAVLKLFLATAFFFSIISRIDAASGPIDFISSPNRVDMVADNQGILYISSTDGNLLRYDLTNKSSLAAINLGGYLYGMDISPDGNNIVVSDGSLDYANRISHVHVVNLPSGTTRQIQFPLEGTYEWGTASVAFADNDTFLVSSNGSSWSPIRKVNLTTGDTTSVTYVGTNGFVTALSSSADHSVIGIAEQDGQPWGPMRYRVSDGDLSYGPTLVVGVTAIAVSRNGQQYAVTAGTRYDRYLHIYDQDFNSIKQFQGTYTDEMPIGVVYSPTADLGFISWANSSGSHAEIQMFDTNSLSKVAIIDASPNVSLQDYDDSYKSGRLRMSSDGSLLFATVNGGINVYAVPEPSTIVLFGTAVLGILAYAWQQRK